MQRLQLCRVINKDTKANPISIEKRGTLNNDDNLLCSLSEHLDVTSEQGENYEIGIPSIWARQILFEYALYDEAHEIFSHIQGEWIGMRLVIDFKEWFAKYIPDFVLHTHTIQIPINIDNATPNYKKVLKDLLPNKFQPIDGGSNASLDIYYVEYSFCNQKNEIEKIYTVIGGKLYNNNNNNTEAKEGEYFTSPEIDERLSKIIPWFINGKFTIPTLSFIKAVYQEGKTAGKGVRAALRDYYIAFKKEMEINSCYSDLELKNWNKIIIPDQINDEAAVIWGFYDKRFLNSYITKIINNNGSSGTIIGPIKIEWIRPDYLFSPKLIAGPQEEYEKNNIKAPNKISISKKDFSHLIPLSKDLLLNHAITINELYINYRYKVDNNTLYAEFTLPLERDKSIIISREYKDIKDKSIEYTSNNLVVFPKFDGLNLYYISVDNSGVDKIEELHFFNNNGEINSETLQEKVPDKGDKVGAPVIYKLSSAPIAIGCKYNYSIGFLFPKWQSLPQAQIAPVTLAVDFGTTSTCIMVDYPEVDRIPSNFLSLIKMDTMNTFLIKEFITVPEGVSHTFTSSYRPKPYYQGNAFEPLQRGSIFFADLDQWSSVNEILKQVKDNLKWGDEDERQHISAFLKQIILLFLIELRSQGYNTISKLKFAYPLTMRKKDRDIYVNILEQVMIWLADVCPLIGFEVFNPDNYSLNSEGLASAAFISTLTGDPMPLGSESPQVVVDMGGGTTDIAIWANNNLLLQASIKFAGNDIIKFVQNDTDLINAMANMSGWGFGKENLSKALKEKPNSTLNKFLRRYSDTIINTYMEGGHIPAALHRFLQLISYSFCAISFYIGFLIEHCYKNKSISREHTNINVAILGNGSKFLNFFGPHRENVEKWITDFIKKNISHFDENKNNIAIHSLHDLGKIDPKKAVSMGLLSNNLDLLGEPEEAFVCLMGEKNWGVTDSELLDMETLVARDHNGDFIKDPDYGYKIKMPEIIGSSDKLSEFLSDFNYKNIHGINHWINVIEKVGRKEIKNAVIGAIQARRTNMIREVAKGDFNKIQPIFIEEVKIVMDKIWGS